MTEKKEDKKDDTSDKDDTGTDDSDDTGDSDDSETSDKESIRAIVREEIAAALKGNKTPPAREGTSARSVERIARKAAEDAATQLVQKKEHEAEHAALKVKPPVKEGSPVKSRFITKLLWGEPDGS